VVKICARCHEVSPGGYRCDACGGELLHTSDAKAKDLPEAVWRNQRVDYGARRGMIFRFLAIFAGSGVALYGVRASVAQPSPWSWIGAIAALSAGLLVWWTLYTAADRGVRIWVLRRGQLQKRKLAKVLLGQATLGAKRP
jgi:hypothetical protein